MTNPYLCPNCKSNRSRFNMIEFVPKPIKMDPRSGEITNEFTNDNLDIFHKPYNGPSYKVQCAVCGLMEDEQQFINQAKINPTK